MAPSWPQLCAGHRVEEHVRPRLNGWAHDAIGVDVEPGGGNRTPARFRAFEQRLSESANDLRLNLPGWSVGPSTLRLEEGPESEESPPATLSSTAPIQNAQPWTAKRRTALVLQVVEREPPP
jgi:hypothetical protein